MQFIEITVVGNFPDDFDKSDIEAIYKTVSGAGGLNIGIHYTVDPEERKEI